MFSDTDSDFEADLIKNGDLFQKSHATKKKDDKKTQDKKAEKGKKDSKAKSAKDCTDDEISLLIDLLESNPCLWDIHHKDYSKLI